MKKLWLALALLAAGCGQGPQHHAESASSSVQRLASNACGAQTCVSLQDRTALDRPPDGYLDTFRPLRDRAGTLAVSHDQWQWNKPVVTVAFSGADEATYALIESAAHEWTAYSGGHFSLQFRDAAGRFRRWTASDRTPAADIRIGFESDGVHPSYFSEIGIFATQKAPGVETMNFGLLPEQIRLHVGSGPGQYSWPQSYEHETVLHEFGHALGLAHEHYHSECQAEIKFDPDPGYVDTFDSNDPQQRIRRPYNGLSPGAILYFSSPGFNWTPDYARFAVDARAYFGSAFPTVQQSQHVDRESVMLYYLPPFLLRSGANSPCANPYWPTQLSRDDVRYFQSYYNQPLPRPTPGDR